MLAEIDNDILPRLRDVLARTRPNKEKAEKEIKKKQKENDSDSAYYED